MEETTIFYTCLSLIFLLLLVAKQLRRHSRNLPPSPRGLPVIGHLHLLKPSLHRNFDRISQQYGPVFSLRLGSRLAVVVSSPSAVEECFTKNDIVFANRPRLLMSKHLGYNSTTIVSSPYGDHWRNLRRISALEIFSAGRLSKFLFIRRDEINRLMIKLSRNSMEGFARVEMKSMFSELTFNNIMRMVAGKRYFGEEAAEEEEARQYREIINEVMRYSAASYPGDFLPFLNWIDYQGFEKRLKRLATRADAFLQELIDEQRRERGGNTMIDHLLSLQEEEPNYYADEIIKGLVMNLLLAGTDTSAVTLEWTLSNLVNHPEVLKKARAEIDTKIGQEQFIDEVDISNLPYLQSIISETFRLYPPAPLLLAHLSSRDCTVQGYTVPRGTLLWVNAWALHRDPNVWVDPTSFRPERFVEEPSLAQKLITFGQGRRACPGVGLAQRIVGLTLGSLMQCFEWERVGEEKVDMSEGRGLTMPKAVSLEALCKARPIIKKALCEEEEDGLWH